MCCLDRRYPAAIIPPNEGSTTMHTPPSAKSMTTWSKSAASCATSLAQIHLHTQWPQGNQTHWYHFDWNTGISWSQVWTIQKQSLVTRTPPNLSQTLLLANAANTKVHPQRIQTCPWQHLGPTGETATNNWQYHTESATNATKAARNQMWGGNQARNVFEQTCGCGCQHQHQNKTKTLYCISKQPNKIASVSISTATTWKHNLQVAWQDCSYPIRWKPTGGPLSLTLTIWNSTSWNTVNFTSNKHRAPLTLYHYPTYWNMIVIVHHSAHRCSGAPPTWKPLIYPTCQITPSAPTHLAAW